MITKRIIPCLDIKNGKVVKGIKFKDVKEIDDPVTLAKYYSDENADELVFYDIAASVDKRETLFDIAKKAAREINIPFTIGGGISSLEDFKKALLSGADKVSINSAAVKDPNLIKRASEKYGKQCVVLSIDTKPVNGEWYVFTKGGSYNTGLKLLEWAVRGESLGAGEIVLNSINDDGMKDGYSVDILKALNEVVNIPIIASGGAGKKEDFLEVFEKADIDAALAASVFHNKTIKIQALKEYLLEQSIEMRG